MEDLLYLAKEVEAILPEFYETVPANVKKLCAMYGYTFVGAGSNRTVFRKGNELYKVSLYWTNQNKIQFEEYQKVKDTRFAQYLQPCHELLEDGKILICGYVDGKELDKFYYPAVPNFYNSLWTQIRQIAQEIFQELQIDLYDLHDANVLYSEKMKHPVIIDY